MRFYVERGLGSERTGPVMSTADFLEEEVFSHLVRPMQKYHSNGVLIL